MQYIKFSLSPGQQCPVGSTGKITQDGYIIWEGEEGAFNDDATFGTILITDSEPESKIINYTMTSGEIDEYLNPSVCPYCGNVLF